MQELQLSASTGISRILVGEQLTSRLQSLELEPVLLIDENVMIKHHDLFEPFRSVIIPPGEAYKTLQTVEHLYRELVNLEVDRSTLIVGVGGGLATDVAGFVASSFLRGLPFGFISSTLLGQVDASIGGKNGVNLDGYKNMVGNIRQPGFVWCDLSLLRSLEPREYVSGMAEVLKYGFIRDADFLDYLETHMDELLKQDPAVLEHVVAASVAVKVDVVEKDEHESGLRRILNFGHTLGHAIERSKGILHGEAVSLGMIMAARLSALHGLLTAAEADRVEKILLSAGLPARLDLNPEELYLNVRKDKKKSGDEVHFVLLKGLGDTQIKAIALKDLKSMIHDLC